MKIKIGNKTILCTRKKDHRDFLFERILELRQEIIQEVLESTLKNKIPVKLLKRKAELIRKYSRRLKILDT
jgi:hypothetical protein|tara:strand:- start:2796 stop:3008 length:213 start_codon:yes stop_codon:yes gene_type:complete